jgi:hypothetical protein
MQYPMGWGLVELELGTNGGLTREGLTRVPDVTRLSLPVAVGGRNRYAARD